MARGQTKTIGLVSQNMNFYRSKEKTRKKGIGHEFEALKMTSSTNYSFSIFGRLLPHEYIYNRFKITNVVLTEINQSKVSR